MQNPIIVIGIGEMASVFTRALLRYGYPVYPVNRETDMHALAKTIPEPSLVLVGVGENALHSVLKKIPSSWLNRLGLLQNELLPRDWQNLNSPQPPTVISVWFEKKKGQDYKVLVPSPVYGPRAPLLVNALASLDIPAWELASEKELEFELVRKNVYILTTNITGLLIQRFKVESVKEMWADYQDLAQQVAYEVIDIQEWLTGHRFDRKKLIEGMVDAIEGDPRHKCMGRSAPLRLNHALKQADEAGLAVPRLREIYQNEVASEIQI
ncbi:hypothetical protein MNBD_GAMMA24-1344 [hydrothermal vent metagenome]|uniref:Ketopantoate reductase C-terminal domain-containing protein n=1 Tax=hydrothermal vent metagenome TaxID=652676 RepID=A0A3B1C2E8_9ZZZZ